MANRHSRPEMPQPVAGLSNVRRARASDSERRRRRHVHGNTRVRRRGPDTGSAPPFTAANPRAETTRGRLLCIARAKLVSSKVTALALLAWLAFPSTGWSYDNDAFVGRTPADPALALPAPAPVTPVQPPTAGPWWQDGAEPRWLIEGSLAPGFWSSAVLPTSAASQFDIGAVASIGFRYVRPLRHHRPLNVTSDLVPAMMWLSSGLLTWPVDTWVGNERGVDLRIRGSGSTDATLQPWTLSFGIAPVFRLSANRSRARFPSVIGALLPEVGVALGPQQRAAYFLWSLFPFSVVLVPRLGMELNLEEGISIPFDGSAIRYFGGVRIGMVLR